MEWEFADTSCPVMWYPFGHFNPEFNKQIMWQMFYIEYGNCSICISISKKYFMLSKVLTDMNTVTVNAIEAVKYLEHETFEIFTFLN